jgi:hypothetical protein
LPDKWLLLQTNGSSIIDILLRVEFDQAVLQLQIKNIVAATSAAEDKSLLTIRALKEAGSLFLPQLFHKLFFVKLFIIICFFC